MLDSGVEVTLPTPASPSPHPLPYKRKDALPLTTEKHMPHKDLFPSWSTKAVGLGTAAALTGLAAYDIMKASRRRVHFRKPVSSGSAVRTARRLGYQLGRANKRPQTELKCFDKGQTNQDFTTASNASVLNNVVQGSEVYQRVGRKIYMKSVRIRGYLQSLSSSGLDYGRIILLYDSQANAALPALADILQNSNAGAATYATTNMNINNRERFRVLRDLPISLSPVTNTGGVLTNFTIGDPIKQSYNIDLFVDLKGLESIYNATSGGTIADITSGSLLLFVISAAGTSQWTFSYTSRLRYYD